jgi:hypothetical protein
MKIYSFGPLEARDMVETNPIEFRFVDVCAIPGHDVGNDFLSQSLCLRPIIDTSSTRGCSTISLLNEIRFGLTHVIDPGAALLDRYSELLASPLTIRF